MLTYADHVDFGYQPQAHGQGWLMMNLGPRRFRLRRMDKLEYRSIRRWAEQAPQRVTAIDRQVYWMFEGRCYVDDGGLSQRQVRAQLATKVAV